MSRSDEQQQEERQGAEDLELDAAQSEGVQGGFASADPAKAGMANPLSPKPKSVAGKVGPPPTQI